MELALENLNNISNSVSEKVSEIQGNFLNSFIGNAINNAVDVGIRAVLPDAIEEEVIDIKDAFLKNGLSDGINKIVETIKDFGKSTMGIVTGNFENISQLSMATKSGGIIQSISKILDNVINSIQKNGIINKSVASTLKSIKNGILNTTKNELSSTLKEQEKYESKLELYSNNWKEAYQEKDFKAMEKAYKKVEEYLEKVMPTEKAFVTGKTIENLHNLIKNKGESFELSDDELKLAENLY